MKKDGPYTQVSIDKGLEIYHKRYDCFNNVREIVEMLLTCQYCKEYKQDMTDFKYWVSMPAPDYRGDPHTVWFCNEVCFNCWVLST